MGFIQVLHALKLIYCPLICTIHHFRICCTMWKSTKINYLDDLWLWWVLSSLHTLWICVRLSLVGVCVCVYNRWHQKKRRKTNNNQTRRIYIQININIVHCATRTLTARNTQFRDDKSNDDGNDDEPNAFHTHTHSTGFALPTRSAGVPLFWVRIWSAANTISINKQDWFNAYSE